MTTPAFPPVDFAKYRWRASATDPKLFQREPNGSEALVDHMNRFAHGEHTVFLAVELDFQGNLSMTEFEHVARDTWIALRFQVPTIAARTLIGPNDRAVMTYPLPDSYADLQDWGNRTFRVAPANVNLEEWRYEIGQKFIPDSNGDQTFVYATARDGRITGLLLHTSHITLDGIGAKVLLNLYLRDLALRLTGETRVDPSALRWGEEYKNLLPCVSEVLASSEPREGRLYQETLQDVLAGYGGAFPRMYPFKAGNAGPGTTRHVQRRFTTQETAEILAATKAHGFTANQIALAALNLVVAIDNPPTSETPANAAFVYTGVVNNRSDRLRKPYSERDGYPGYCLGTSALCFSVDMLRDKTNYYDKMLLLGMAELVKQEYTKQKDYPALLATQGQVLELILSPLFAGAPPPPPWTGPYFCGDGISENQVDREYVDCKGVKVLDVRSIFTSVNKTDPGPFFRFSSWRDMLQLDVDFNEHARSLEAVNQFVENWKKTIRLILA